MKSSRISVTEAKKGLSELVKRVSYGNEQIVLDFHGKPQAALISWEQFQRLQETAPSQHDEELLDGLRELRQRIAAKYEALPESADVLRETRRERVNELTDMR